MVCSFSMFSSALPQPLPIVPQYRPPVDGVHVIPVHVPVGQPHTLATPAPPQVCGEGQPLHVSVPPQPSPMVPQYWPPVDGVHVVGVQFVGTQMLSWHVCPDGQDPHASDPPQPLPMVPQ